MSATCGRFDRGVPALVCCSIVISSCGPSSPDGSPAPRTANVAQVPARVETAPVPFRGDVADDPCIWIHPTDPALSVVIGTNKNGDGGLHVYALDGSEIHFTPGGALNNVDIRYDFPLGGSKTALITAGNRSSNSISVYAIDPSARRLKDVASGTIRVGVEVYGSCMYRSRNDGKFYFIVAAKDGRVEQWELFDNGSGGVGGRKARAFGVGSQCEGCVADDLHGALYIGEEAVGIWKYGVEPDAGEARTAVDRTGPDGHLTADVEGLALYQTAGGGGYLLASSQGSDTFAVYERTGNNRYIGSFAAIENGEIDAVSGTDGIDVTNFNLGPLFPDGLFVAQDDGNGAENQNFKLVSWRAIAERFDPPLTVDPVFDPR